MSHRTNDFLNTFRSDDKDLAELALLIANQEDINASGPTGTALHLSVSKNWLKLVEQLIQKGANVNAVDIGGNTALFRIDIGSDPACVELLLKNGADPLHRNTNGSTALHQAAFVCHTAAITLLLQHHADPNSRDHDGKSPLHVACGPGLVGAPDRNEAVRLLLAAGANRDRCDTHGMTALDVAQANNRTALAEILISK